MGVRERPTARGGGGTTQFHVLSFEGPDPYARAGGIASRITGLTEALARRGFETHLWFVGDPDLPGHETRGVLQLHRWCQWISRGHPGGVYEGEEWKRSDFAASLPPFMMQEVLLPHVQAGGRAVILAEEWQTADAVLHLDHLLRLHDVRQHAAILWNANNVFGFDRLDWHALGRAAVLTTVSRYMKHIMRARGVDPIVIPNGLAADAFRTAPLQRLVEFSGRLRDRMIVTKIARWDPDKGWLHAVQIIRELKRQGLRPLLVARGGVEAHGADVFAAARAAELRVVEREQVHEGVEGLLDVLQGLGDADMVSLRSPVDADSRRVLLRAAAAVLANSRHEPFGLVGLETMAAGGLACTGCSGEDYAVAGRNAVVLQTEDPQEFAGVMQRLRANPEEERAIRRAGQVTARQYAWPQVIERLLLPRLQMLGALPAACRVRRTARDVSQPAVAPVDSIGVLGLLNDTLKEARALQERSVVVMYDLMAEINRRAGRITAGLSWNGVRPALPGIEAPKPGEEPNPPAPAARARRGSPGARPRGGSGARSRRAVPAP